MNLNKRPSLIDSTDKSLYKSKSPDTLRQKIPSFKPKTLQQIFQQTNRKKSPYKNQIQSTHPQKIIQSSNPIPYKQFKKSSINLADLIANSGHQQEIQSVEYTNSQIQQDFYDNFDNFSFQQLKKPQKYQLRVFTPQCQTFSKLSKQQNIFKFKNDSQFYQSNEKKINYWKGQITLATSMCEDDFNNAEESVKIPDDIKDLIFASNYYIYCINSQNKSEYLLESSKGFQYKALIEKIVEIEKRSDGKYVKNQIANCTKTIKFLSTSEMDQFMAPDFSHEYVQKHLQASLRSSNKFIQLIYFVQDSQKLK